MTVTATPFVPIKKSWPKRSIIGAIAFALAFGLYVSRSQWAPAMQSVESALAQPTGS